MSGPSANASFINVWADGACGENASTPDHQWKVWEYDTVSDCCAGGTFIAPDGIPRNVGLLLVWLLLLCWIFMGVALGAEVFMTAIEVVTAKETKKKTVDADGKEQIFHVRVWNATVANLTLMALGSSAPEILLNVIEVVLIEKFNSGALGPSTIVGSAAFNLMVITAVCIIAIPAGEKRTLKQKGVFLVTAAYSVIAYIWLLLMVMVITPQVIDVWEAVVTCLLLVALIIQAYYVDRQATKAAEQKYLGLQKAGQKDKGSPTKAEAAAAIKAAKLGKDATPEEIKAALEDELLPPKSKLHYRKQAMEKITKGSGGAKVAPGAEEAGGDAPMPARTKVAADADTPAADPNAPGTIKWVEHSVNVMESAGSITIYVERVVGSKGAVSCAYSTKNQKAVAGKDFEEKNGELSWADGDTSKQSITIGIYDDDEFEKDEEFTVVLKDLTGGANFFHHTDGGEEEDICTVLIVNDDDRASRLVEAMRMLKLDSDSLDLAATDWKQALVEAVVPPSGAGAYDLAMHFLMVPWKLMFALCPPAGLCGGWPCFIVSLIMIGIQVVFISDFANQMGCLMYIKSSVTAITFVALGTSLPDTFASMQAAVGDKWADNSIGNVTGSNSVNVFFGLGLPWLIGSLYWAAAGGNQAWKDRHGPGGPVDLTAKGFPDLYNEYKDKGGFIVLSGDLGNSVIVFTICAITTLGLILVRRAKGNQELGGDRTMAMASASFLVFLWIIYLLFSILTAYGKIPAL